MAKRFIDTNIFKKGFLKGLPPNVKLFYIYLFCECDHYGIWNIEMDVAEVRLGVALDYNGTLKLLSGKVVQIDGGRKWFIPDFIHFQYGKLNPSHKLHKSVIKELEKKDLLKLLTITEDLPNTYGSVKEEDMDMVKEEDMDMVKEEDMEKPENNAVELLQINDSGEVSDINGVHIPNSLRKAGKTKKIRETKKTENGGNNYVIFVDTYKQFIEARGVPFRFTSTDGKAAKEILEYLANLETVKGGKKTALEVWEFILSSWDKLNQWTQTQIQLRQINSQLPNIIEQLRQTHGQQSKTANSSSVAQFAQSLRTVINASKGSAND